MHIQQATKYYIESFWKKITLTSQDCNFFQKNHDEVYFSSLHPGIKNTNTYMKIITFKYDVEIWVKFFSKPDSKYLYHHSLFCQGKRIVLLFNDWLVASGGGSSLHCEEFRHCLMISNSTSHVRTFPKHT